MNFKTKEFMHELRHHLPFTIVATITAILIFLLIQYYYQTQISETLFEFFHPAHVIASALVTAGVFYKQKPNFSKALIIGIFGSIILGSLSDIILPYLGGNLLGLKTIFHLPLIEEPIIILSSAIIGSLIGIWTKQTKIPHFIHVYLSVFASLFYLLAFTPAFNAMLFVFGFVIIVIAVIIPCCMSDILFPFLFLGKKIKTCNCK